MKFRGLAVLVVGGFLGFLISCSTDASSPPVTGTSFLLVTTRGDTKLSSFEVDLGTGELKGVGGAQDTGSFPTAMAISPSGGEVFVANTQDNSIAAYSVSETGTLTAAGQTPSDGTGSGVNPVSLVLSPNGQFLFVVNQGPLGGASKVSVFSVSGTALAKVTESPAPTGDPTLDLQDSVAAAITPAGDFLYVTNRAGGTVAGFAVATNGSLARIPGFTFTTGASPSGLSVTPEKNPSDKHYLYVSNAGSSNISAFLICDKVRPDCLTPDGTLTEITDSPFSAGLGPGVSVVSPSRRYFYVVDQQSNQVSGYTISSGTGALTPVSAGGTTTPTPASTGLSPVWVAMTADEKHLYVANSGSSSISGFTIAETSGRLIAVQTPVTTGGEPSAIVIKGDD